ncbi:hypothetical protein SDRG_03109 [Saprolegnia diclina VS20]|uniref:RAP domain-containing protein n=1 Tax=Saprolegnia diclina (strain VS20) TaxID=1156394 RepID=T0R035_SAPDV|nr:hypothetical protein SDRG_03109 [Saprolegnia diclina VS20]EQC39680.1 hypothetical protein SDRG_03109 [Saprolegnia diclina VS20]|eukprot:XP_008606952.1 hypothetical protein SDRG_03109 [Saprolegnia diclina VS20]
MLGRAVLACRCPALSRPPIAAFSTSPGVLKRKPKQWSKPNLNDRIASTQSVSRLLDVYAKDNLQFTRLHLAMTASRLGKLRTPYHKFADVDKQIFHDLASELTRRLPELTARDFSNALHGLTRARAPDSVISALIDYFVSEMDLDEFQLTELSMVVHGLASNRFSAQSCAAFNHVEDRLVELITNDRGVGPQHVANIVWSYATAGAYGASVYGAAETYVATHGLDDFKPQELGNLIWGFMRSHPNHGSFVFEAVADHLEARPLQDFTTQNIGNIVAGFAKADQGLSTTVLEAVVQHMTQRLPDWLAKPQNLCNALWALALFEATDLVPLKSVLDGLSTVQLGLLEKRQLYQFMLEASLASDAPLTTLYPSLYAATRAAMMADDSSRESGRSAFVPAGLDAVTRALEDRHLHFEINVMTDIGYTADVEVHWPVAAHRDHGVLIMIDGPSRYWKRKMRLRSRMKKRHLTGSGYHVLSFPYFALSEETIDAALDELERQLTRDRKA